MMKAPAKSSGNKRTAGKLRLWVWVCAVLFFAGLTSTAFALWGGHRLEGNEGVKALYEYVRSYDQNSKDISQGKPEELIKRLLEEPFETSTDFELEQEDLNIMGLPIPRLSGNVEAKYDLQDLGLKARFFWFEWGLYLLGHEFVIDDLGKLQAAELPEAGLDAQMPLGERAAKLLPRLPDDDAAKKRVFEALAHSVPVNATHTEEALFYSPMDGRDTETEAVVTYLDAAALERTAAALIELMEEDANLSADISAMYAPLAAQFGEKMQRLRLPSLRKARSLMPMLNGPFTGVMMFISDTAARYHFPAGGSRGRRRLSLRINRSTNRPWWNSREAGWFFIRRSITRWAHCAAVFRCPACGSIIPVHSI